MIIRKINVMNQIAVGVGEFELPTPTQSYHIYSAYSFRFFTKGFCITIGGPIASAARGAGQVCYFIVSILNIGYFDTIFSNSEIGASLLMGIWGRAPGAICKYAFKIGAR